jgi:hypothetical protein
MPLFKGHCHYEGDSAGVEPSSQVFTRGNCIADKYLSDAFEREGEGKAG